MLEWYMSQHFLLKVYLAVAVLMIAAKMVTCAAKKANYYVKHIKAHTLGGRPHHSLNPRPFWIAAMGWLLSGIVWPASMVIIIVLIACIFSGRFVRPALRAADFWAKCLPR